MSEVLWRVQRVLLSWPFTVSVLGSSSVDLNCRSSKKRRNLGGCESENLLSITIKNFIDDTEEKP